MNHLSEQSSIADIAAEFNRLKGTDTDVKTLAKRGKGKLLAQIEVMLAATRVATVEPEVLPAEVLAVDQPEALPEQPTPPEVIESAPTAAKKPAKPKSEPKTSKEKGPVIRVVAEAMLLEVVSHDEDKRPYGHPYDTILNTIHEQFEGAKTTVACLRWYAVHMRERGEKVPNRPRAAPTAPAKKTEA